MKEHIFNIVCLVFILFAWAAIFGTLPGCGALDPSFYCAGSAAPTVTSTQAAITNGTVSQDRLASVALVYGASRIKCSGVAYSPRTVLTAAHCAQGEPSGVVLEDGGHRYDVESWLAHDGYDLEAETWPGSRYDLAMLFLSEDAPPPYVNIIYDPPAGGFEEDLRKACTGLVAHGFGRSQENGIGTLREASYLVYGISLTTLVGNGAGGEAVCSGDSGGALYAYVEGHPYAPEGTLMLAGIHVAAFDSAETACQGPTTHINLINFKPWIVENAR